MSVAGRRAEILWRKGTFTTGKGMQRTYDTFVVRFGLFVPFSLGEAVHIWDIPMTVVGACKSIPLRPDPVFKRSVLTSNWAGWGSFALLMGSAFLAGGVHPIAGLIAFVVAVGLGSWAYLLAREPARDRLIRLLLGLHDWGSSDPATWADELIDQVVDPKEALASKSFLNFSQRAFAESRWAEAMWGARIAVAIEDASKGEALTDEILAEPEVAKSLRRVRRRPETRDEEFGKAPPLRRWVDCDPREFIGAIE